jgi:hypothetical protein
MKANEPKLAIVEAIRRLQALHWSARRIARELDIDCGTVGPYLNLPQNEAKPTISPAGWPTRDAANRPQKSATEPPEGLPVAAILAEITLRFRPISPGCPIRPQLAGLDPPGDSQWRTCPFPAAPQVHPGTRRMLSRTRHEFGWRGPDALHASCMHRFPNPAYCVLSVPKVEWSK